MTDLLTDSAPPDALIPPQLLRENILVLGQPRTGKSFAVKAALVEPLLAANRAPVIIDPTGAYWGLRLAADGKGEGFKIAILGGRHADVPIAPEHGARIADLVADGRLPCVIDLSLFDHTQQLAFMRCFTTRLFAINTKPLHLIVDEADEFAPQNPAKPKEEPDAGYVLHMMDRILRRGGIKGFRVTLITQRPQVLHANLRGATRLLIALGMTSPLDIDAVHDWMKRGSPADVIKEVLDSLPTMPIGTGWMYAPLFALRQRVAFPAIATFDCSKSPDHDDAEIAETLPFSFAELRAALAPPAPLAGDDDGVEYRPSGFNSGPAVSTPDIYKALTFPQTVPRWDRERLTVTVSTPVGDDNSWVRRMFLDDVEFVPAAEARRAKIDAYGEGVVHGWDGCARQVGERLRDATEDSENIARWRAAVDAKQAGGAAASAETMAELDEHFPEPAAPPRPVPADIPRPLPEKPAAPRPVPVKPVPKASVGQRILDTLAELHAMGVTAPSRAIVALLCNYTNPDSRRFREALVELDDAIEAPQPGTVALTKKGQRRAPAPRPLTGPEIRARLADVLDGPVAKLLDTLTKVYPAPVSRQKLAETCGYTNVDSRRFREAVSKLSDLGFVVTVPGIGALRASPLLFPERAP